LEEEQLIFISNKHPKSVLAAYYSYPDEFHKQ